MSYEDGWAAINLDMPSRIPRTEMSAHYHWELIRAVTGIRVGIHDSDEVKTAASNTFMRAWNYDMFPSQLIMHEELGEFRTDMPRSERPGK